MKFLNYLVALPLLLLAFAFTACERDYDMPPLNEPKFELPAEGKLITIADLRTLTKAATQDAPVVINNELTADSIFLKARIIGDDRSGNIFKTLYIADETGGISFLVDQSGVYNDYPEGQEVYVSLKGLCVSTYGDEQQIGEPSGYLYRTPYELFKQHVFKNGFPVNIDTTAIKTVDDISTLTDADKYTLIRFAEVHFEDGGKANFAEDDGYGTHNLVDKYGNSVQVRTSNYADFAAQKLPVGTGTVIAIPGKFRGTWQLTIRTADDVYGFDGKEPGGSVEPEPTDGDVIFYENLGTKTVEKDGNYWPYLKDFTGWASTGLTFTDVNSTLSARAVNGTNNIWFPANKDNELKISGIKAAGYSSLTLTYDIAANLYNNEGEQDAAAMVGSFNGKDFATPSQVLSGPNGDNNKFYTITITLDPSAGTDASELIFKTAASANTMGMRLTNIKLVGKK